MTPAAPAAAGHRRRRHRRPDGAAEVEELRAAAGAGRTDRRPDLGRRLLLPGPRQPPPDLDATRRSRARSDSTAPPCGGRCRCCWWPACWSASPSPTSRARRVTSRPRDSRPAAPRLPVDLPGVVLASLATLALGVVLGPEAPLIAIGGGLGVLAVQLAARDAPPMAATVMAAAGSFAAISTLLGSPIVGAFLLMEASGLGGPLLGLVLVPGLLAAGIGTLIFIGLDQLTGLGTFSLAIPGLPTFSHPTGGPVPVGPRHRGAGHVPRDGHPPRRAGRPVPGAEAPAGLDAGGRPGGGRRGDRLRRAHPQERPERPVLGAGRAARPRAPRVDLDRRRAHRAHRGQVDRLLRLAVRVPGRPDLPGHVHRGGHRRRRLPPAGPGPGARRGHGDRRHDDGHAPAAPDGDAARRPAGLERRAGRHPPGHRGRRRRLRADRPAAPDARPTSGPRAGTGRRRPHRQRRPGPADRCSPTRPRSPTRPSPQIASIVARGRAGRRPSSLSALETVVLPRNSFTRITRATFAVANRVLVHDGPNRERVHPPARPVRAGGPGDPAPGVDARRHHRVHLHLLGGRRRHVAEVVRDQRLVGHHARVLGPVGEPPHLDQLRRGHHRTGARRPPDQLPPHHLRRPPRPREGHPHAPALRRDAAVGRRRCSST